MSGAIFLVASFFLSALIYIIYRENIVSKKNIESLGYKKNSFVIDKFLSIYFSFFLKNQKSQSKTVNGITIHIINPFCAISAGIRSIGHVTFFVLDCAGSDISEFCIIEEKFYISGSYNDSLSIGKYSCFYDCGEVLNKKAADLVSYVCEVGSTFDGLFARYKNGNLYFSVKGRYLSGQEFFDLAMFSEKVAKFIDAGCTRLPQGRVTRHRHPSS